MGLKKRKQSLNPEATKEIVASSGAGASLCEQLFAAMVSLYLFPLQSRERALRMLVGKNAHSRGTPLRVHAPLAGWPDSDLLEKSCFKNGKYVVLPHVVAGLDVVGLFSDGQTWLLDVPSTP